MFADKVGSNITLASDNVEIDQPCLRKVYIHHLPPLLATKATKNISLKCCWSCFFSCRFTVCVITACRLQAVIIHDFFSTVGLLCKSNVFSPVGAESECCCRVCSHSQTCRTFLLFSTWASEKFTWGKHFTEFGFFCLVWVEFGRQ